MNKKYRNVDLKTQEELQHKAEMRNLTILPFLFFGIIALVIIVSAVKHQQKIDAGIEDPSQDAMRVEYISLAIGSTVYVNDDALDQTVGSYFYIGSDWFDVTAAPQFILWEHDGNATFTEEAGEIAEFVWTCPKEQLTDLDLTQMVEELSVPFGEAEVNADGIYVWHSEEGLGENEEMKTATCGFDADGVMTITGSIH